MLPHDIVRAWKDADFRDSLGDAQAVPSHPSGSLDLPDDLLEHVAGGASTEYLLSLGCCQGITTKCMTLTSGMPIGCTAGCLSVMLTNHHICQQEPT